MNYEELLVAKSGGKLNQTQMHIGEFYRAKVDNKYQSRVDLRRSLIDNITFCEGLRRECEENVTIADKHQLHFTPVKQDGEIVSLAIAETGQYMSYEELLRESPAVVANKDFLFHVLEGLVSLTTLLHKRGIRQICFSPHMVFARKGDYTPLLLTHGSYYLEMGNLEEFFGEDVQYVAIVAMSILLASSCRVSAKQRVCLLNFAGPLRRLPASRRKTAITRRRRC